jgi:hypothetical protein
MMLEVKNGKTRQEGTSGQRLPRATKREAFAASFQTRVTGINITCSAFPILFSSQLPASHPIPHQFNQDYSDHKQALNSH